MNTLAVEINNLVAKKMVTGIKEKVSSDLCFEALAFVKTRWFLRKKMSFVFVER